jgi:hypothetical protein
VTQLPPPKPKSTCPWCTSLHIADVKCVCDEPCSESRCPAHVEVDIDPFAVRFL